MSALNTITTNSKILEDNAVELFQSEEISINELVRIGPNMSDNLSPIVPYIKNKDIVIISGEGITRTLALNIVSKVAKYTAKSNIKMWTVTTPSLKLKDKISDNSNREQSKPIVIGIGGGSCIDMAKAVAQDTGSIVFVFPTVLSSDCLVSPVSVLIDTISGEKVRIGTQSPEGIIVNTTITGRAPKHLILSGVFDLFSNASALLDMEVTPNNNNHALYSTFLARAALDFVINIGILNIHDSAFQSALANGLILSGISMQVAGNSEPASGGEHLISHAIDKLGYGTSTHGEQVYIGMLCMNEIRKFFNLRLINSKYLNYLIKLGSSKNLSDYGITVKQLVQAVSLAQSLRPERQTALKYLSNLSEYEIESIISKGFSNN